MSVESELNNTLTSFSLSHAKNYSPSRIIEYPLFNKD